jgi:hypothetical protein
LTKKGIFLRLDLEDLSKLESLAKKKGVSPQTLVKMQIKELLAGFVDDSAYWTKKEEA